MSNPPVTRPPLATEEKKRVGPDLRAYQNLKIGIHRELLNHIDFDKVATPPDDHTRRQVYAMIQQLASNLKTPLPSSAPKQLATELTPSEKDLLSLEILNEVFGLGPLEPLLQDPTISDILVNGANEIYIERGGVLEESPVIFKDNAHLMRVIDQIVSAIGRHVDESTPMVDARLADGSRVHVIIPPAAIDGPHLSIRRFGHIPIAEQDLLATPTLTQPMLELLRGAVKARLNIIISGGTGAGKTTLLNVLSGYISEKERIVTIEDSAELQLKQRHVVRLECRPADAEGKGAIMQRQLVINSLRMRPNRIILGEVRSDEALDMLQAMNTGHDGSMTTLHANSPIRKQITSAITLVLQMARFSDGSRRVTHITEITGMEVDIVSMQDVFLFEKQGLSPEGRVVGTFTATGIRPRFEEKLRSAGIALPANLFEPSVRYRRG
jgi:pilus assembly protein CpaF